MGIDELFKSDPQSVPHLAEASESLGMSVPRSSRVGVGPMVLFELLRRNGAHFFGTK